MVKEFRNKEPLSEANLYTRELDGINGKKWELIKEVQNLWKTIYKLTKVFCQLDLHSLLKVPTTMKTKAEEFKINMSLIKALCTPGI
ncbi:unnamed protein product [Caretta caretta]